MAYRPGVSDNRIFSDHSNWRGPIWFPIYEYHGDTSAGLGPGHQTGWTALVALLRQSGGQLHFENVRTDDERLRTGNDGRASAVQERKVA